MDADNHKRTERETDLDDVPDGIAAIAAALFFMPFCPFELLHMAGMIEIM
ncbi:MAG: hypothetical protein ACOYJO_07140 [Eubacterium sp.]|jgi:hypothetical protein